MPQHNNMAGPPPPPQQSSAGPGGLSNQMAGMNLNQAPPSMVSNSSAFHVASQKGNMLAMKLWNICVSL